MRRLDPREIAKRLVTGRARAERMAQQWTRPPASPELERSIERATTALRLVMADIESTTDIRAESAILRYDDWIFESGQDPSSWLLGGSEEEGVDPDPGDELWLACRFGSHTFALNGEQSSAEMAADVATQIQDDVIDELWKAWPRCPTHEHPMSPTVEGSTAVWMCPANDDVTTPIGKLGAGPVNPLSEPSSSPPG